MPSRSNLVICDNVSWAVRQQTILQQVSFSIAEGEIVTLIGPNGAGKSSLVKLVLGLVAPTQGRIVRTQGLTFGYMPQRLKLNELLPLTVEGFLRLNQPSFKNLETIAEPLDVLPLLKQSLHSLSGGEMQRVLLTRAALRKPQLLVLDEPTQGVDVQGQAEVYRHIAQLRDQLNCAVFMVSHDLHVVMAKTDSVICLNHHVCCQGTPDDVSMHPEYLELFGHKVQDIAVYTHHHDHQHNLHGDVLTDAHQHCNHP